MDYIITDAQTSPITLQSQYSEKLAYMPNTFFIGDHKQMFPHIKERIILKDHKVDQNGGHVKDNVAVINTIDKRSILEKADIKQISQVSMVDDGNKEMEVEVKVTIAQLPTTQPIDRYLTKNSRNFVYIQAFIFTIFLTKIQFHYSMIQNGQVQTSVNGLTFQNGLTTNLLSAKAATGEEVPEQILITSRQQYGLPEDAIVYCNFNQLYKIDPPTLKMWVNILNAVPNSVLWLLRFPQVIQFYNFKISNF